MVCRAVFNDFQAHPDLLSAAAGKNSPPNGPTASYLAPAASGRDTFKLPKQEVDRRIILESTQPIIERNGMLRWAFANVAHASTPPCQPVLSSVRANPQWAAANSVQAGSNAARNTEAYWGRTGVDAKEVFVQQDNSKLQVRSHCAGSGNKGAKAMLTRRQILNLFHLRQLQLQFPFLSFWPLCSSGPLAMLCIATMLAR